MAKYFGSSEPSSGQFLIYRHGAFSECTPYGIPCCLQIILIILKFKLKIYWPMYILKYTQEYLRIFQNTTKNLTRIDSVQEGSIASNSWVSVPIFFYCPLPRLCNRISRYLWHWSRCSLLYRGHNRLLCRRNKVWLQRWRTEWDQFINGCGSRILDGCCISRNMLLITCSRRHRAEICPQHIEQSQHTL